MLRKCFHLQVFFISSKTILGSGASKPWLRLCGRPLGGSSNSRGIRDPESASELWWRARRLRPDGLCYMRFSVPIRCQALRC